MKRQVFLAVTMSMVAGVIAFGQPPPLPPGIEFTWDKDNPNYEKVDTKFRLVGKGKIEYVSGYKGLLTESEFPFYFPLTGTDDVFAANPDGIYKADLGTEFQTNPGAPPGEERYARTVTIKQHNPELTFVKGVRMKLVPKGKLDTVWYTFDDGIRYITFGEKVSKTPW